MTSAPLLPEWQIVEWLNSDSPLSLSGLRGKVIMIHSFQMLCPGCVNHAMPQAEKVHRYFGNEQLQVIGLHTVFEHHSVMTRDALAAFIHENRISHPVGVDQPGELTPIPKTMQDYGLRGTPSLLLVDRAGRLRAHEFGQIDDLALGVWLGKLLAEP